nr:unnamed protein product [Callosobruchus chinensis]
MKGYNIDFIRSAKPEFVCDTISLRFSRDKSLIIAIVNEYMDRVFDNIHNFAIKSGLDPTPLQNFSQKVSIVYLH